jgi:hypothetical protein
LKENPIISRKIVIFQYFEIHAAVVGLTTCVATARVTSGKGELYGQVGGGLERTNSEVVMWSRK